MLAFIVLCEVPADHRAEILDWYCNGLGQSAAQENHGNRPGNSLPPMMKVISTGIVWPIWVVMLLSVPIGPMPIVPSMAVRISQGGTKKDKSCK
jgi:hypothetical protein